MQTPFLAESVSAFPDLLRAVVGVFAFVLVAWIFSSSRKNISWRVVFGGIGLQVALAVVLLWIPVTAQAFEYVAMLVAKAIGMANEGSAFLFGSLAAADGPAGFVFAFRVLPVIIYFAAVMASNAVLAALNTLVRVRVKG